MKSPGSLIFLKQQQLFETNKINQKFLLSERLVKNVNRVPSNYHLNNNLKRKRDNK